MRLHGLHRLSALATGAAFALTTVAAASAQEATDEVGSGVTSFGIGEWFNLGIRLALVVAVIWGAVWAMRWYVRRVNHGGARGGVRALEILETHALGPNRSLHLVRLGDRAVLVGATQERITQLLTVEDPEEFKRLTEVPEDETDVTSVRPRAAGAMSLLGSVRTGFLQMRARQSEMNARIKEQREVQRETQREARETARAKSARGRASAAETADDLDEVEATTPAPRFGALKGVLSRSSKPAARTSEEIIAEAEQERQSLFDRALASIDAIEVMPAGSSAPGSIAAGPRARASYGAAHSPAPAPTTAADREAQIAELQRAIAAARKTAS